MALASAWEARQYRTVHVGDVQSRAVAVGAVVGHDLIRAVRRPGHGAVIAVARICGSFTSTAPVGRELQVLRVLTSSAMSMKYSSR